PRTRLTKLTSTNVTLQLTKPNICVNKIGPNVLEITATPVLIIPAFLPNLPGLDALDVIVIINGKTGPSLAPTNMRIIISKNKVDAKPDNAVVIDVKITAAISHALRFFV